MSDVGLMHLRYRLEVLQRICDHAQETNNDWLALQCIEMAAKEMGGWYMGQREGEAGHVIARLLSMSAPANLDGQREIEGAARGRATLNV